jgi:gluconate kinase
MAPIHTVEAALTQWVDLQSHSLQHGLTSYMRLLIHSMVVQEHLRQRKFHFHQLIRSQFSQLPQRNPDIHLVVGATVQIPTKQTPPTT